MEDSGSQRNSTCQNQKKPKDMDGNIVSESGDGSNQPEQDLPLKKFFCPCCNIGYVTSEEMIDHIKRSPIKVKTYSCNICLLEFFVKSDLIDHQRVDHQMMVHKKYKCDECDLDYTTMGQLARHKKMHEEIAEKLAASGIFLPRPEKTDPEIKRKQPQKRETTTLSPEWTGQHDKASEDGDDTNKKKVDQTRDSNKCQRTGFVETKKQSKTKDIKSKRSEQETIVFSKKESQEVREKSPAERKERDEMSVEEEEDVSEAVVTDNDSDPDYRAPGTGYRRTTRSKRKKRVLKTVRAPKEHSESDTEEEGKEVAKSGGDSNDPSCTVKSKGKRKRGRPRLKSQPSCKKSKEDSSGCKKTKEERAEVEIPSDLLNEDGSIRCPDCDVMCSSLNGLNRHRKFHFRTMDKLKCVFCDSQFDNREEMGSHMSLVHPLKKCQKAYMLSPVTQKFPCTEPGCSQVFSACMSLTKHKTKVHGIDRFKDNECEDCGKRFPSRSALTVHRRMHTDERPFKCDLCPKAYRASSSLVLHRKSHSNKKPYVCEFCGQGFTCPNSLQRHTRCRHTGEKPYMCDGCGATFINHSQLAHHAKIHRHGRFSGSSQHACERCGKEFVTEYGFKSHQDRCVEGKQGTGGTWKPKPVICEVCGREFPSRQNLKNHMVTHTDERPHKCRFCDAAFRHYKSKYSHEKVHKGDKDFICALCGKAFYQRINLKTHMTSHNSVKDLACRLCGKKFNSEHNRKRHEKRCKNYLKCPICSAIFRVHHRLVRHMNLNHHGIRIFDAGPWSAESHTIPDPEESSPRENSDSLDKSKLDSTSSGQPSHSHSQRPASSGQPSHSHSQGPAYFSVENDRLSEEEQYVVSRYQRDKPRSLSQPVNHRGDRDSPPPASSVTNYHQTESPLKASSASHCQGTESRLVSNSLSPLVVPGVSGVMSRPSDSDAQLIARRVNHYQDAEMRLVASSLSEEIVREVNRNHHITYLY